MENDQAERLRETAAEIKISETSPLPSRKEVHGKKRKETQGKQEENNKSKPSFWWTRFLLAAFILLIALTLTYQYWVDQIFSPVHSEIRNDVEQVDIER
jgi:hypothetical protein